MIHRIGSTAHGRSAVLVALIIVTTIACLALTGARPAYAQQTDESQLRLLTVIGDAEVRAVPDLAQVQLGVETEAPTAAQAREQNAQRANRIIIALRALGIPERAIQTSTFQIYPVRRFEDSQGRGEPPIVGYRVVNIVMVRTEDLNLVPRIIDESVAAGANRVENVAFTLRDENVVQQTALRQAVAKARENARVMASELGVAIVRVHRIQQGGVGIIRPPVLFRGAAAEAVAPTPIFPGEITISASVTLTYLIR